ncbi:MAG: polyphosphate kinase 2 [Betaproteobacteria bacterium]|nr:polyphosphate kinase 2 [Betaproteobacteria bacterium]
MAKTSNVTQAGKAKDGKSKDGKPKGAKSKKAKAGESPDAKAGAGEPLGNKDYERELKKLHVELVKMQEWVKHAGLKVCIVFEGRDTAGKGGTIKAITERVSPRTFRVIALPAPSDREKSQMYVQRYLGHLPAAGEVVIFDRSWYNRAGVERVMGFVDGETLKKFYDAVPKVEKAMIDSGIILIKYWLEVSEAEQTKRLTARIHDGRKTWKLSPMDLKSYAKWYDYSRARDDMFKYTHTAWAPWIVADSNDKKKARLNIIADLLSRVPYKEAPREKVKLPRREKDKSYREPKHVVERIKERY